MNTPKISIIIPVYKAEKGIDKTIELVLNQSFHDLELILVDDGSPDNSGAICDEYAKKDPRIKVCHQENQGAGVARNTGIKNAKGKYLWFVDADDSFELDACEQISKAFDLNPNADILVFNASVNRDGVEVARVVNQSELKKANYFKNKKTITNLFSITYLTPWNKSYKREFVEKHNLEYQNLKCCNDNYFTLIAFALAEEMTYIDCVLYHYKTTGNSTQQKNTITSTRGNYSMSVIEAGLASKKKLKEVALYDFYKANFYTFYTICICNEFDKSSTKAKLLFAASKFLPVKYFIKLLLKIIKLKLYHNLKKK